MGRVRAVPSLCELYPGICLTTEEKARKNLSPDTQISKILSTSSLLKLLQTKHTSLPSCVTVRRLVHLHGEYLLIPSPSAQDAGNPSIRCLPLPIRHEG